MNVLRFFMIFIVTFLFLGISLLVKMDFNFYQGLFFHFIKPSLNFFEIFNLIYIFLLSISLSEIFYIYEKDCLNKYFLIKLFFNITSFFSIKIFFNMHNLLLTLVASGFLFISLLYLYENISLLNEKSTKYLDLNVLYSLFLIVFFLSLYILNNLY